MIRDCKWVIRKMISVLSYHVQYEMSKIHKHACEQLYKKVKKEILAIFFLRLLWHRK
mgnify:CR=1 FL=1